MSEIVTGVNTIRSLKRQLADWAERLADNEVAAADAIAAAQGAHEQARRPSRTSSCRSSSPPTATRLNYREKLFEKLSDLPPVVASADARPTTQSYAVYEKLAGQADEQLAALNALIDGDLANLNAQLGELGVSIIGA